MPSKVLFLSSSLTAGAATVSTAGDRFTIELTPPIQLPVNSKPRLALRSAGVWWTMLNISAARANHRLWYTNDLALPQKFVVTLTDGLYGLSDLNTEINRQVVANGHTDGLITLSGVEATSRVYTVISAAGWQVTWNQAGTFKTELGITTHIPPSTLSVGALATAGANPAALNTITSILVHSDLAAGASNIGGSTSSALASILPNVSPGSLISYEPNTPITVDVPRLAGASISGASFWLTNQSGAANTINTNSESWSIVLELGWE